MKIFILLFALVFASVSSFAEPSSEPVKEVKKAKEKEAADESSRKSEISEILDSMGYPELQVVPRASERLAIEAKDEGSGAVFTHWPVELAGIATAAVGLMNKGNKRSDLTAKQASDANTIANISTLMGVGWAVGAGIIGVQRPYRTGLNQINKYSGKDERSTLLRERLAEEALEKPARTMHFVENAAMTSLAICNIASAWHANESGKITAGVGLLLTFIPYFFEDRSIDVYEKHIEYKKKIYTPLKSAYFSYDDKNKELVPMTGLAWEF